MNKLSKFSLLVFVTLCLLVLAPSAVKDFHKPVTQLSYGEKGRSELSISISSEKILIKTTLDLDKTKQKSKTSPLYPRFSQKIYFEPGKSDISLDQRYKLKIVADLLRKDANCTLMINAFTDSRPGVGEKNHLTLSRKRGESIIRALRILRVENPMEVNTFGNLSPKLNLDGTENHQESRRVEFGLKCP